MRGPEGDELRVSAHALRRFWERVRPTLDRDQAEDELLRLLPEHAPWGERPEWAGPEIAGARYELADWLLLGDDICFPVEGDVVVTCLTRSAFTPGARVHFTRHKRQGKRARWARDSDPWKARLARKEAKRNPAPASGGRRRGGVNGIQLSLDDVAPVDQTPKPAAKRPKSPEPAPPRRVVCKCDGRLVDLEAGSATCCKCGGRSETGGRREGLPRGIPDGAGRLHEEGEEAEGRNEGAGYPRLLARMRTDGSLLAEGRDAAPQDRRESGILASEAEPWLFETGRATVAVTGTNGAASDSTDPPPDTEE